MTTKSAADAWADYEEAKAQPNNQHDNYLFSDSSWQEGTSAFHKIAAIAVSILSPGQAATEMRRDAFRK